MTFPPPPTATPLHCMASRGGADAAHTPTLGGVGSNPGMHPHTGHESTGAAGNDAGGNIPWASGNAFIDRRNSLAQSASAMRGKSRVQIMRNLTREALNTALAAELQGRG